MNGQDREANWEGKGCTPLKSFPTVPDVTTKPLRITVSIRTMPRTKIRLRVISFAAASPRVRISLLASLRSQYTTMNASSDYSRRVCSTGRLLRLVTPCYLAPHINILQFFYFIIIISSSSGIALVLHIMLSLVGQKCLKY